MANMSIIALSIIISTTILYSSSLLLFRNATIAALSIFWLIIMSLFSVILNANINLAETFPDIYIFDRYLQLGAYAEETGSAVRYAEVLDPLFILSGRNTLAFTIYRILTAELSVLILAKSVTSMGGTRPITAYITTSILCHAYPSFLIFTSSNTREFLALFSTSLYIYSVSLQKFKTSFWPFAASLAVNAISRPFMAICTVAGYIAAPPRKHRLLFMVCGFVAIPVLFYMVRGTGFSVDWLLSVRESRMTVGDPQIYNIGDTGIPPLEILLLLLQFALSPLPILHDADIGGMRFFIVDLIYVALIFTAFPFVYLKNMRRYTTLVLSFLIFLTLPALWEAYIGGAVRHRIPAVIILMVMLSHFLSVRLTAPRKRSAK